VVTVLVLAVAAFLAVRWLSRPSTVDGRGTATTRTVVLIPGYGGDAGSLAGLAGHLRDAGMDVVVADIADGHGDLRGYGAEVADLAAGLVADGAASVDLVGYSAGGLIARAAVEADPAVIGRVVTIATPHAGTAAAGLGAMLADAAACPTACRQLAPDSDFLDSLRPPGDPARWLSAYSASDDVIRPADSSLLDGVTNVEVTAACGTGALDHGGIVRSPATAALVRAFLRTGTAPTPGACS
jgi:triacylglycerol lipase